MSFVVLHADRLATLAADDPVIGAAETGRVEDAIALLAEAGRMRQAIETQRIEAVAAGHHEGHAAGRAEGLRAGEAEVRAELFALAVRAADDRRRQRADVAALALEVVRRIAGEVGPEALVAGLTERATAALVPDTVATVRVAPATAAAVTARLAARTGIAVEADAGLAEDDCIVETPLGRSHAGLETQLAAIAKAWEAGDDG